jgi:hypothetical protein
VKARICPLIEQGAKTPEKPSEAGCRTYFQPPARGQHGLLQRSKNVGNSGPKNQKSRIWRDPAELIGSACKG